MGEDFFVLTCRYCDSTLRITMPEIPPAYLVAAKATRREVRFSIDRYLKEKGEPLTSSDIQYKRVYYPYWKIDAVLLKARNRTTIIEDRSDDDGYGTGYGYSTYSQSQPIENRKTEVTLAPYCTTFPAGCEIPGVPVSLGMRAEYIKVEPFAEESPGGVRCTSGGDGLAGGTGTADQVG